MSNAVLRMFSSTEPEEVKKPLVYRIVEPIDCECYFASWREAKPCEMHVTNGYKLNGQDVRRIHV